MKIKIICLVFIIFFGLFAHPCYSYEQTINSFDTEVKNYTQSAQYRIYAQNIIEDALKDINFVPNKDMYIIGKITPRGKLYDIELKKSANTRETNKKIISILSNLEPFGQMPESMSDIGTFKIDVTTGISPKGYLQRIILYLGKSSYPVESTHINWAPYMRKLENNIKSTWQVDKRTLGFLNRKTVVLFVINKNGEITDYQIVVPSGNDIMDKSALDAIQKNLKQDPLPADFKGNSVTVEFAFESKIYGQYYNNSNAPNPYYKQSFQKSPWL